MNPTINIKRVYEKPLKKDGLRILVDRLWPRGMTKEEAAIDDWKKDIAPTTALRKWFSHDPELWPEFQKKYKLELQKNKAVIAFLKNYSDQAIITLLYAGKDQQRTHALILQQYLQSQYHK